MKDILEHVCDNQTGKTVSASILGLGSSAYPHVKAFFAEAATTAKATTYDVSIARVIALLTVAYLLIRITKALWVRKTKQEEEE